ncbi:MAG: alkaline phosphatase family protein [Spirochaetaceae bacterium]|nr:MAG: alkaline phosphatase family protein [Spirochaetaceae bacterium]
MDPDLFIFLGDNIYADTVNMSVMRRKYERLAGSSSFRHLLRSCPVVAVWDDHDYGANDAGSEYPKKEESKRLFLDFWQEPADSPRWQREGIYAAYQFGPEQRRVQVLLLDTRTFRDPLVRGNPRPTDALGPYVSNPDPAATLLGDRQWQWLEAQLDLPAQIRIIVSSIQLIPEFSGWESWANFPFEKRRLLDLLKKNRIEGVIFISGDRHFAEISVLQREHSYPLYEMTSSALNLRHPSGQTGENLYRIDGTYLRENFGDIRIRWSGEPAISLSIRDLRGDVRLETIFPLSELTFPSP